MKRYLIIAFSLLAIASVQAQTFNYTGLEIKQEKVKKKNVYEWEQFVMANYALGFVDGGGNTMHSFGLTYGRVKLLGFYVNAMVGTGFHYGYEYATEHQTYYPSNYNYTYYRDIYPFYTGKSSDNRASFVFGGIVRMVIPMYLYLGMGYGYQSYTRQISSGEWVMEKHFSTTHSGIVDVGLQGNIKGFTISVGYDMLFGKKQFYHNDFRRSFYHEVKIGLGYTFKVK